jgi:hypothetical protein
MFENQIYIFESIDFGKYLIKLNIITLFLLMRYLTIFFLLLLVLKNFLLMLITGFYQLPFVEFKLNEMQHIFFLGL